MGNLQINLAATIKNEVAAQMANFKHLFEKGQLNRVKGFQQLKINSAAIDSPDHSQTEQDISVNAQYEDKGRSYNCFYCTGAGHWPKEC
jgi:hypothetical protein